MLISFPTNGEKQIIFNWRIGLQITPTFFRLISFTHTILAKFESDPSTIQEIALVDKFIAEGEYPTVLGVSGNYYHEQNETE